MKIFDTWQIVAVVFFDTVRQILNAPGVVSARVARLINSVITYSMYTGFTCACGSRTSFRCCVDLRGVGLEWLPTSSSFLSIFFFHNVARNCTGLTNKNPLGVTLSSRQLLSNDKCGHFPPLVTTMQRGLNARGRVDGDRSTR